MSDENVPIFNFDHLTFTASFSFFFSISKKSEEDPFFQTPLNKKLFPHPPTQSFNTDSGSKKGRGAVFQSWPLHVFDDPKKDLIFYHLNQISSADCK